MRIRYKVFKKSLEDVQALSLEKLREIFSINIQWIRENSEESGRTVKKNLENIEESFLI